MKTLSTLKKDLEFNRGLSSLIEALKNIAVAQYRILEQRLKFYERLPQAIEGFFDLIDINRVDHPFVTPGQKPLGVVAVTSDTGLLGGLNMQIINRALNELTKAPGTLMVIGERGKSYLKETKVPFVAFSGVRDEERFEQAMQLKDYLVQAVLKGSFGHLKVVYARPISFTVQHVEVAAFLPYVPQAPGEQGVRPEFLPQVIVESELADMVEYLVSVWIGQRLYEIFGLSRLAEFAARFVHLEESHQKLKEMDGKIRMEYFRVRHELIDRNMRELFAARIMYGS